MTIFLDRKKAFEAKFVHDANLDFKTAARRNKLLGQWVAKKLALDEAATEALIASYATAAVVPLQSNNIVAKATADLNGVATIDEIEAKLGAFTELAHTELKTPLH